MPSLQLPAAAGLEQARALLAAVDAAAAGASAAEGLQIDAAALQRFDSSAIALLLHAERAVQARGGRLRVLHAPAQLRELAQLYGVDGLLSLDPEPGPEPGSRPAAT
ncbi:MAG: STAS domain-containing protein [Rubrivivax sp.]